jgi:hypothetical protein
MLMTPVSHGNFAVQRGYSRTEIHIWYGRARGERGAEHVVANVIRWKCTRFVIS